MRRFNRRGLMAAELCDKPMAQELEIYKEIVGKELVAYGIDFDMYDDYIEIFTSDGKSCGTFDYANYENMSINNAVHALFKDILKTVNTKLKNVYGLIDVRDNIKRMGVPIGSRDFTGMYELGIYDGKEYLDIRSRL